MGRIDQETVRKILDTADIVDVVSDFVKLRRSGANYKGLCPFHNERTPSFSVNKARNICKCFSCGAGGSPVNFIMLHEQLSYVEALRYLARKYNIEIIETEQSAEEKEAQSHREALLAVNEFALDHFTKNLLESADGREIALPYFRHRGLSDLVIKRFKLGYSIDRPADLFDAAKGAGFKEEYLIETGLTLSNDRGCYDRFRGRVMFPVFSISGRVIAFGGRTMKADKNVAKYVNSPESVIYKKNLELYGLYQAKNSIAKNDKCYMVEGYLDVISMHQAGIENTVASSGTSLTEGQIRAVRRFTNNVTLIYDADAAGIKASLRGIKMLLAEGMNVRVLALPPGDDPDSFAQTHSSDVVAQYLKENEADIIEFMADKLLADVAPNDPTARAKAINVILEAVACIVDPVARQEYITQSSRLFSIPEQVIVKQLDVFTTRHIEELEKERARAKAQESISGQEQQPEITEVGKAEMAAPLIDLSETAALKPYEEQLARYIVRYGLLYVCDLVEDDGTMVPGNVIDLISAELRLDDITFTYPPYASIAKMAENVRNNEWPQAREAFSVNLDMECGAKREEALEHIRQTAKSVAEIDDMERHAENEISAYRESELRNFDIGFLLDKLLNTPDDLVRNAAVDLATDKYTLSRIYMRQGGKVETEDSMLHILVPRAVNELREQLVAMNIKNICAQLALLPPEETEKAQELLSLLTAQKKYQQSIAKVLGERIIRP